MNTFSKEDRFFMDHGETKMVLRARKRKIPLSLKDDSQEKQEEIHKWTNLKRFNNEYQLLVEIKKGDVFNVQFLATCGSELHGDHFVVALADSKPNNPLVMVVPLTSYKPDVELNPASDLYLGFIAGIMNGKRSVAVINQIQAMDKSRLLNPESLTRIDAIFEGNKKHNEDVAMLQYKNSYRLTKEQLRKLQRNIVSFFFTGFVTDKDID